jgi:hypothetical protein
MLVVDYQHCVGLIDRFRISLENTIALPLNILDYITEVRHKLYRLYSYASRFLDESTTSISVVLYQYNRRCEFYPMGVEKFQLN